MSQPFGFGGVNCQQCGKNSFGDVRLLQLGQRMMMDKDFLRKSGQQLLCCHCNDKYLSCKRAADAEAAAAAKAAAVAAAAEKEAAEAQAELDLLEAEVGATAGAPENASSIFASTST